MDALKNHWDKVILTVVAIVTLVFGGLRISDALSFGERFQATDVPEVENIPEFETASLSRARGLLSKRTDWKNPKRGVVPSDIPLFHSVPIVEYQGQLIYMFDPAARKLREPVENSWLLQNGLDFLKADVLEQDADSDGFTNLEEWTDKTSPRDPNQHPPYWKKLHFVERKQQSYALQFSTKLDESRYQFTRLPTSAWPERKTIFLAIGGTSDDGQFRLDAFEQKEAQVGIVKRDVSEVTITYLPKNEKMVLVRQAQPTVIPTYFVSFAFDLGQTAPDLVKEGEFFTLSKDSSVKYKVVDIQEDSAEITFPGPQGEEKQRITKKP